MARGARRTKARRGPAGVQTAASPRRVHAVDAMRGAAVVLMAAYHFCFDLDYLKVARFDFHHAAFWLDFRALIVTAFLFLVGVSLRLSGEGGLRPRPFLRRLAILAACAGAVTAASYTLFPASGIYFGVLHFIAVASVLSLVFLRFHAMNLFGGLAWLAVGLAWSNPWFDQPWATWIGFTTHKPITEDYVPMFPWFGVVLLGLFAGRFVSISTGRWRMVRDWRPGVGAPQALTWLGRHSLFVYMVHQPVLLGVLYVLVRSSETIR